MIIFVFYWLISLVILTILLILAKNHGVIISNVVNFPSNSSTEKYFEDITKFC